jgi:hypothetical protein
MKTVFVALAASAIAVGCGGAPDPQGGSEQTSSTTSEDSTSAHSTCTTDTCTSYVGTLKSVNLFTGEITIESHGNTVTLAHTFGTVHVGVVPGPMHQIGVVPGPMHWLWMLWDKAIENHQQPFDFVILLSDLTFEAGKVRVTTTDGATISTVQPVP